MRRVQGSKGHEVTNEVNKSSKIGKIDLHGLFSKES